MCSLYVKEFNIDISGGEGEGMCGGGIEVGVYVCVPLRSRYFKLFTN